MALIDPRKPHTHVRTVEAPVADRPAPPQRAADEPPPPQDAPVMQRGAVAPDGVDAPPRLRDRANQAVSALAAIPASELPSHLELEGHDLFDSDIALLARIYDHDGAPPLLALDLARNNLTDRLARVLPFFGELETLILDVNGNDNAGLGDAVAIAAATLPCLKELSMKHGSVGQAGTEAIAASQTLRRVDLSYNDLGDGRCEPLAASKSLWSIRVEGCKLRDRALAAFAHSETLAELIAPRNLVGDEGVVAACRNRRLFRLSIAGNHGITTRSIDAMMSHPRLREVNLRFTVADRQDAKRLEKSGIRHVAYSTPTARIGKPVSEFVGFMLDALRID